MKLLSRLPPATLVAVTALVFPGAQQPTKGADQSIPLIVMDNVPLPDAIQNLARQAGINYILDPVLSGSAVGTTGVLYRAPMVTKRLENVTARGAMEQLLAEHQLMLIESPATTVSRITFADRGAKPVAAGQVIGDTNEVTALIVMDGVPLTQALGQLAAAAGLKVELDARIAGAREASGRLPSQPMVSFRWEKMSAAQALASLLDAYDLEMTRTAEAEKYQILPKAKPDSKAAAPEKAGAPSLEK